MVTVKEGVVSEEDAAPRDVPVSGLAEEELFRVLVEGVADHALLTIDAEGTVTSWNKGAERLLGYRRTEMLGTNFARIFTPEDLANGVPAIHLSRAREMGRAEDEGWRVCADGKRFWAFISKTAFFDDAGKLRGFAVLIHDTTERRKIALAVEGARQEKARLQEVFLSNVSHELRTPLTAIYFFVSNLAEGVLGELSAAQQEHVNLALENIEQLRGMVTDLLDITRVDAQKLTVRPRLTNPANVVATILNTCRTSASAKGITLRAFLRPGIPMIWADPLRVGQVLTNLIGNAVKFTPAGGAIRVEVRLCPEDKNFVRFSVQDNGCGIHPDHFELIFERLSQIKDGQEAGRTGLGLGLFIAKGLVEEQGGRIWVESEPNCGSIFFFRLPVSSIARKCGRLFSTKDATMEWVTLMALDLPFEDKAESLLQQIGTLVEHCVHPCKDVVLDWMDGLDHVKTLFVIAGADAAGAAVVGNRILSALKEVSSANGLRPAMLSRTLRIPTGVPSGGEGAPVIETLTRLIQAHLTKEEKL
jgi:PAS domain S-box-containing protein